MPLLVRAWQSPVTVAAVASLGGGGPRGPPRRWRTRTSACAPARRARPGERRAARRCCRCCWRSRWRRRSCSRSATRACWPGNAAEAGALALAGRRRCARGARARRCPGWSRARARVSVSGGEVRVRAAPAGAPARARGRARGVRERGGGGAVTARGEPSRRAASRGRRSPPRVASSRAAAAVESFFLEPAAPRARVGRRPSRSSCGRSICVFGLARGCGATVVARALAAELALRDPAGRRPCAARRGRRASRSPPHAATRLARALEDVPGRASRARSAGCAWSAAPTRSRLADTARHHAPLVIDAGSERARRRARRRVADRTVLVTTQASSRRSRGSAPSASRASGRRRSSC